jgi:type I restriction enzyme S subunit
MRRVKRPVDVSYLALALEAARLNDVRNQNDLPLITQAILRDIVIPWPESLEEQRAISFVHADVDAFIAALQRLIAKKEAIREAMVQELMSGSTRLPGFADQWPEVTLSAVATGLRGAGLSKEAVVPSGSKPCILYGELFTTYGRRIGNVVSRTNTGLGIDSQAGDVLIPGSTTTIARDLATASALHTPGVLLGGDINIVRPGKLIDPDWLAYYVTYRLPGRIAEIAQGTTIKHLYVKDILRCRIALPTVEEQREIVAALLDVEEEVSILRRRLKKGGEIRQGIMQQLPTGRTRFYISGEAA